MSTEKPHSAPDAASRTEELKHEQEMLTQITGLSPEHLSTYEALQSQSRPLHLACLQHQIALIWKLAESHPSLGPLNPGNQVSLEKRTLWESYGIKDMLKGVNALVPENERQEFILYVNVQLGTLLQGTGKHLAIDSQSKNIVLLDGPAPEQPDVVQYRNVVDSLQNYLAGTLDTQKLESIQYVLKQASQRTPEEQQQALAVYLDHRFAAALKPSRKRITYNKAAKEVVVSADDGQRPDFNKYAYTISLLELLLGGIASKWGDKRPTSGNEALLEHLLSGYMDERTRLIEEGELTAAQNVDRYTAVELAHNEGIALWEDMLSLQEEILAKFNEYFKGQEIPPEVQKLIDEQRETLNEIAKILEERLRVGRATILSKKLAELDKQKLNLLERTNDVIVLSYELSIICKTADKKWTEHLKERIGKALQNMTADQYFELISAWKKAAESQTPIQWNGKTLSPKEANKLLIECYPKLIPVYGDKAFIEEIQAYDLSLAQKVNKKLWIGPEEEIKNIMDTKSLDDLAETLGDWAKSIFVPGEKAGMRHAPVLRPAHLTEQMLHMLNWAAVNKIRSNIGSLSLEDLKSAMADELEKSGLTEQAKQLREGKIPEEKIKEAAKKLADLRNTPETTRMQNMREALAARSDYAQLLMRHYVTLFDRRANITRILALEAHTEPFLPRVCDLPEHMKKALNILTAPKEAGTGMGAPLFATLSGTLALTGMVAAQPETMSRQQAAEVVSRYLRLLQSAERAALLYDINNYLAPNQYVTYQEGGSIELHGWTPEINQFLEGVGAYRDDLTATPPRMANAEEFLRKLPSDEQRDQCILALNIEMAGTNVLVTRNLAGGLETHHRAEFLDAVPFVLARDIQTLRSQAATLDTEKAKPLLVNINEYARTLEEEELYNFIDELNNRLRGTKKMLTIDVRVDQPTLILVEEPSRIELQRMDQKQLALLAQSRRDTLKYADTFWEKYESDVLGGKITLENLLAHLSDRATFEREYQTTATLLDERIEAMEVASRGIWNGISIPGITYWTGFRVPGYYQLPIGTKYWSPYHWFTYGVDIPFTDKRTWNIKDWLGGEKTQKAMQPLIDELGLDIKDEHGVVVKWYLDMTEEERAERCKQSPKIRSIVRTLAQLKIGTNPILHAQRRNIDLLSSLCEEGGLRTENGEIIEDETVERKGFETTIRPRDVAHIFTLQRPSWWPETERQDIELTQKVLDAIVRANDGNSDIFRQFETGEEVEELKKKAPDLLSGNRISDEEVLQMVRTAAAAPTAKERLEQMLPVYFALVKRIEEWDVAAGIRNSGEGANDSAKNQPLIALMSAEQTTDPRYAELRGKIARSPEGELTWKPGVEPTPQQELLLRQMLAEAKWVYERLQTRERQLSLLFLSLERSRNAAVEENIVNHAFMGNARLSAEADFWDQVCAGILNYVLPSSLIWSLQFKKSLLPIRVGFRGSGLYHIIRGGKGMSWTARAWTAPWQPIIVGRDVALRHAPRALWRNTAGRLLRRGGGGPGAASPSPEPPPSSPPPGGPKGPVAPPEQPTGGAKPPTIEAKPPMTTQAAEAVDPIENARMERGRRLAGDVWKEETAAGRIPGETANLTDNVVDDVVRQGHAFRQVEFNGYTQLIRETEQNIASLEGRLASAQQALATAREQSIAQAIGEGTEGTLREASGASTEVTRLSQVTDDLSAELQTARGTLEHAKKMRDFTIVEKKTFVQGLLKKQLPDLPDFVHRRIANRLVSNGVCGFDSVAEIDALMGQTGSFLGPQGSLATETLGAARLLDDVPEAFRANNAVKAVSEMYSGEARAAFGRAANRLAEAGVNADDAARLLEHAPTVRWLSKAETSAGVLRELQATGADLANAAQLRRVASFIEAVQGTSAATDVKVLTSVARSGIDDIGTLATIAKDVRLARNPLAIAKTIDKLAKWGGMSKAGRVITRAGVALEFVALTLSLSEAIETDARIEHLKQTLEKQLYTAGFRQNGDVWRHAASGAELKVSLFKETLEGMDNPAWTRVGVDALSAGIAAGTLCIAPTVLAGPWGIALIGVQVTVQTAIEIWNQTEYRAMMRTIPMPVLALLGTGQLLGKTEADVIADNSNWMVSDSWLETWRGINIEGDKVLARKKAFLAIAYGELVSLSTMQPELFMEIVGDEDPLLFFSEEGRVYKKDFDAFFRPFLAARLFEMSNDGGVKWDEFRELKTDEGAFDWENVTQQDLRTAVRESLLLYAMHRKELSYRNIRESLTAAQAKVDALPNVDSNDALRRKAKAQAEVDRLRALEENPGRIFGTDMRMLPAREPGETQASALVNELTRTLERKTAQVIDDKYSTAMRAYEITVAKSHGREKQFVRHPAIEDFTASREELGGVSLFRLSLPEGLAPQRTQRSVDLNYLHLLAFENQEQLPVIPFTYEQYLAKAKKLYELEFGNMLLRDVGTFGKGSWYAHHEHKRIVEDFGLFLERAKAFDPDGKLAKSIAHLRSFGWESDAYPGDPYLEKRTDAFRQVFSELEKNITYWEAMRYRISPPHREQMATYTETVGYDEYITTTNTPSLVVVVGEGKESKEIPLAFTQKKGVQEFLLPEIGTVTCERESASSYSWNVCGKQKTRFYAYEKNQYGIEQPGSWVQLETPPQKMEIIPPGQDFIIDKNDEFVAELVLTDGTTKRVRVPKPFGASAADTNAGKQLLPYVKMTRLTDSPHFGSLVAKRGKPSAYVWTVDSGKVAWRFQILEPTKIRTLQLTPTGRDEISKLQGATRTIDIAASPDIRSLEKLRRQVSIPEKVPNGTSVQLSERQSVLLWPSWKAAIKLTLADGRVIEGTEESLGELYEYLSVLPRTVREFAGSELKNGLPNKPEDKGLKIVIRNPQAVRSIQLTSPGNEAVLVHIEQRDARMIRMFGLRKQPDGSYERSGWEGKFFPRPDGSLYWTGGRVKGRGPIKPQVWRDGKWGVWMEQAIELRDIVFPKENHTLSVLYRDGQRREFALEKTTSIDGVPLETIGDSLVKILPPSDNVQSLSVINTVNGKFVDVTIDQSFLPVEQFGREPETATNDLAALGVGMRVPKTKTT